MSPAAPSLRFSFIIPTLNEEVVLPTTLRHCISRLRAFPGSRIIVVDNGSTDRTFELEQAFAECQAGQPVQVSAIRLNDRGIGYAYHHGIAEAVSQATPKETAEHWIVLTAADLPFGFSDLEHFLGVRERTGREPFIAIGSKSHPRSQVRRTLLRKTLSLGFRGLARILLGIRTKDPQGSFFLPARLAEHLNQQTQARNYFFSTELTYHCEQMRIPVIEMPIHLKPEVRPSTVQPIQDSLAMLRNIVQLRRREGGRRHGLHPRAPHPPMGSPTEPMQ